MRQILSHHTSKPCQPQKEDGTAGPEANLKTAGLDTALPDNSVRVTLPDSHALDDGLELVYHGAAAPAKAAGSAACCMEILCYLLVGAPANVCLAAGPFINGDEGVQACRDTAQECQTAHLRRMVLLGRNPRAPRPLCEFVEQQTGPRRWAIPGHELTHYEPLGPDETQAQRDQKVVELLQEHVSFKAYTPNRLHTAAWSALQRLLERGGLPSFLRRQSAFFDVQFDAQDKVLAFQLFRQDPLLASPGLGGWQTRQQVAAKGQPSAGMVTTGQPVAAKGQNRETWSPWNTKANYTLGLLGTLTTTDRLSWIADSTAPGKSL